MPDNHPIDDDDNAEQYASSEDSDFAPETADAAERESLGDSDSDDNDDDKKTATPRHKRDAAETAAEDVDLDNSGDETVIRKAEKKRKKKRKDKGANKSREKFTASSGPVTIDVDALWEQMKSGATPTTTQAAPKDGEAKALENGDSKDEEAFPEISGLPSEDTAVNPPAMIRIKRKYNFAGKVHTEEKLVPRDSAEAKLYLASQGGDTLPEDDTSAGPSKRAPRKAFRSAFEPVLEPLQRRGDLNLGMAARLEARESGAKKLNTVEKSRMDWAGFVDKEGIKDDLELAGKSKGSYAERQDFLARSEARREEEARRARVVAR
ncbi:unnamed protein product [Parascedosporium putredinis]|uniref:SWR1-complex protein 5 n=1 Tax=Parascedosporium putredinis TaxID=1442378 RepID=A0A9P1GXN2_9PEZI|nr:unnamed protein product [Parascedosporium putredinis]CAI7989198.1 unnamed protein product [Parascedosporium putredinis]